MNATVNGHSVEPGCYIAGYHGQYGPDVLERVLTSFGLPYSREDCPTYWRDLAENDDPNLWDNFYESADNLLYLLNSFTDADHIWHWHEGELFLGHISEMESL